MKRRDLLLLLGGTAAVPMLDAAAQSSVPVVGFMFIGDPERSAWWLGPWRKALAEAGLVEGRDLTPEYRWGRGDLRRMPAFAADLVARRVAVIVATSEPALVEAKKATTTIPIVFNFVADPVEKGFARSFAEPGGNITGISTLSAGTLEEKRLQLLRETVPVASRIGYLVERQAAPARATIDAVIAAGKALGVEVVPLVAGSLDEVDQVFATARQRGLDAILIQSPSTYLYAQLKGLLEVVARHRLPTASGNTGFAAGGGLMEFSYDPSESPRLAANYVVRILNGQNPALLPIQQPSRTRFVLNLGTARALGLALSPAQIGRADVIIE